MAWLNHFWKFSCGFLVDFPALPSSPPKPATTFSRSRLSLRLSQFSLPSHCSVSASNLLTLKFALDVWCDPQFSALPKVIHFLCEMRSKLRWVNHQQGFVVGVSSRGRPVEESCEHGLVINHRELVVQLVAARKTGGCRCLVLAVVWKDLLTDAQVSHGSISQNAS